MFSTLQPILQILLFPAGLFLVVVGLLVEWIDRKLVARLQNRIGPRWFQPLADIVKLLAKEEILPSAANPWLFIGLPMVALAGCLTAALYVPLMGLAPAYSFSGDLIVTLYLLSLLTLSKGIAGWNTSSRFSLVGATRGLTQQFAYEAPFLLALLGPAIVAGSWQIDVIMFRNSGTWILFTQPIGFLVALIGLMGKLELPPFDAPEAETEIVAGATTDYSGRGLAVFNIAKSVEFVVGLTLIATLYLGGLHNPIEFLLKTLFILVILITLQTLLTRLRIDQTVGLWWRYGVILVLVQWMILIIWKESLLL
jgi:NADH-quinone oxidoreductase subunit H